MPVCGQESVASVKIFLVFCFPDVCLAVAGAETAGWESQVSPIRARARVAGRAVARERSGLRAAEAQYTNR